MSTPNVATPPQVSRESPQPLRLTRWDLAATGLLVASVVGMFWKVIFTPAMLFYRDISNYTYPTTLLIREICRQGALPYWNPYLNYGQPVLANPNLLFFYPSTLLLLLLLLPFDLAYTLHFVLHFALAGIGTYLLARTWGQSYLAAFFASFVFVFSGPVLSLGNLYNTVACCAWIPWALLATHFALENKRLRPWIIVAAVFALQWLAAEPLTMMATFGLCFAYAFYRDESRGRLWSKPNIRIFAAFALVGCGMLLLCAAQFLPAADMLRSSHRSSGLTFEEVTTWSMNPLTFLEILLPNFSGGVVAPPAAWVWLVSDRNFPYNPSNFVGFTPLFFAFAEWAMARDRRRNFVAGAAGILLLLSLGHFTPVFALARLLLPPLAAVRFPMKLLVHAMFLLSILAGWGFDALDNAALPWKAQQKRLALPLKIFLGCTVLALAAVFLAPAVVSGPALWAFYRLGSVPHSFKSVPGYLVTALRMQLPGLAGFCLGAILLLVGLQQKKTWARPELYLLALLSMVQLVMVNSDANPTVPKSFYTYRPVVLDQFKAPPETYRFLSQASTASESNLPNPQSFINFESIPATQGFSEIAQGVFGDRIQLRSGSMSYGVEGSINLDPERSAPPFLYDLKIYLNRMQGNASAVNCLLGRTNVKYIISATRIDGPDTRLLGDVFNGSAIPSRLYEDLCFVPRAYVASNSEFLTSSDQTLKQLASPNFDARSTVILAAANGSAPPVSGTGAAGQVQIAHRGPNSVTLHAQLVRPGYVLLLDRFDPNWRATVDGRPVRVLRANQLFRAVYAGAGEHQILFEYRQAGLTTGLAISLVTLISLLLLSFFKIEV
jgi:hypothetical protein